MWLARFDEKGPTEELRFLSNDDAVMAQVVKSFL